MKDSIQRGHSDGHHTDLGGRASQRVVTYSLSNMAGQAHMEGTGQDPGTYGRGRKGSWSPPGWLTRESSSGRYIFFSFLQTGFYNAGYSATQVTLCIPCTGNTVCTTMSSYREHFEADGNIKAQGGYMCGRQ